MVPRAFSAAEQLFCIHFQVGLLPLVRHPHQGLRVADFNPESAGVTSLLRGVYRIPRALYGRRASLTAVADGFSDTCRKGAAYVTVKAQMICI